MHKSSNCVELCGIDRLLMDQGLDRNTYETTLARMQCSGAKMIMRNSIGKSRIERHHKWLRIDRWISPVER